jgi:hypothetical protein
MKKLSTTLIYVLSSLSLLCCCFAGLGVLVALPSFLIANKKLKEAYEFPDEYDMEDAKGMKTAKTFALVALIINGLYFVYNIYYFATTDWSLIMEKVQEQMNQIQ